MKFKIFSALLLILGFSSLYGQNKIRWMTWEEALSKQDKAPRKIMVDVITEWCGWCKKMDATSFNQDAIAKYINETYYPVKFDAETKTPINFNGTTYDFIKTFNGGYHELAAFILQGKLSYPTLVFFDEKNTLIQAIPGFQGASDLEMILHFFGGDFHKTISWRKFTRNYNPIEKNIDKNGYPSGLNRGGQ